MYLCHLTDWVLDGATLAPVPALLRQLTEAAGLLRSDTLALDAFLPMVADEYCREASDECSVIARGLAVLVLAIFF